GGGVGGRERLATRAERRLEPAHVERDLAVGLYSICACSITRRHDLGELRPLETDCDVVVDRDSGRKAVAHEPRVARPAQLFAVVVRTRTARQKPEAVPHPLELRTERIGHSSLEPADRAGAPAREEDAVLPRLTQHLVEAVREAWENGVLTGWRDRKSTRLNSSHGSISYAVFFLTRT